MVIPVVVAHRIAISSLRHHQFKLPYVRISGLIGLNLQYTNNGKPLSSWRIFRLSVYRDLVAEHPSPPSSTHLNPPSTINFHRLT